MGSSDGGYFARPSHRYLNLSTPTTPDSDSLLFEFDESDIYNSVRVHHHHRSFGNNKLNYRSSSTVSGAGNIRAPSSVPVNIPDWSKILGNEYVEKQQQHRTQLENGRNSKMEECYEEGEGEGDWDCCVPPHEFLARTRVASLSVHEGVGRTLKGRDLSRVRNAIWAKTGFSD